MTERASWRAPTTIGFAAKCAIAALRKHNLAIQPLLHRAGLSQRALDDPASRVSAVGQVKFLEYAAKSIDDNVFGLRLAEKANPREAGLLFYVVSAAKNLGDAWALLARYCRIANEGVRLKLARRPDGVTVEFVFVGIPRHHARQFTEFEVAVLLKAFREITGRDVRPTVVAFAHSQNFDLRKFERAYGCRVEFGASSDQLQFSNETLALPLITGDPHLLETLRPFCDEAAKARNTAIGSIRTSVENEVPRLLPHGQAQAAKVAKALGVSVRTLSRRLSAEATTFVEVVDQLRCSLALEYLKEPGFTLAKIAWLLGYEGSTSFHHAFKRWTGRSPSAARNESGFSSEYRQAALGLQSWAASRPTEVAKPN